MGFSNFQLGWQICERLNIPLLKLSELCHAGRLTAYRFEDQRQVLASSQCNNKFKYPDNTTFTIKASKTGIVAINKKATEDFNVYVDRKLNDFKKQNSDTRHKNKYMGPVFKASLEKTILHLENIREMSINYCGNEYIVYYNKLTARPLFRPAAFGSEAVRLYGNEQIFFEVKEEEGEVDLEYLELNDHHNGGIKKCVTKLYIKKEQDSFGNTKYILSSHGSDAIQVKKNDPFINRTCDIFVDMDRLKRDSSYSRKYEDWRIYLYKYSVDYFHKEDSLYSRPLKHEVDFFIFDYDEYKKRFHFLEDEETSQRIFFNYIKNLVFDENEVKKGSSYEIAIDAIKQDPQRYMTERCLELEKKYNDDAKTLKIIKAYHMAITGSSWKKIHKKLWPKRVQNQEINDKFISGKLGSFESIAKLNRLPYIRAKPLRDMKASEKESIVEDMLKQLAAFHTHG